MIRELRFLKLHSMAKKKKGLKNCSSRYIDLGKTEGLFQASQVALVVMLGTIAGLIPGSGRFPAERCRGATKPVCHKY